MLPTLRRTTSHLMPHGASPQVVAEVVKSFRSSAATSAPADIERIVRHARTHVPFYRRLDAGGFETLPVVSKPMMVDNPADFFDRRVDPAGLTTRMSSGTSGITFTSYFDVARIAHHRAELVAAYEFLGADPYGSFLHGRDWFGLSARERAGHALRGKRAYAGEQDERSVRAIAGWLRRRRGTVIIGLPSYLEVLFERFEELDLEFRPRSVSAVVGTGEPATAVLAEMTRTLFGLDLSMRYSNTENGIFGVSEGNTSRYKLNTASFHFEILDLSDDRPAPPGEVGRIVITDLYSEAMPFIRYDTGDLGRFAVDSSGAPISNVLEELTGRMRDFLVAGTQQFPRKALYYDLLEPVELIPEIRQFQLRQNGVGRYTWVLNANESTELEGRLRRILDEGVGDIVSCRFIYEATDLRSGSGKRQLFVSEIEDPERLICA